MTTRYDLLLLCSQRLSPPRYFLITCLYRLYRPSRAVIRTLRPSRFIPRHHLSLATPEYERLWL